ncbi:MFS transporter [Rhodococcus sp. 14-2483-1-2]|uniref:MFS transporter n=1 Tax=Rhodococcus sp. 14-2483-1-2 TaxID=2023147 RepID=UPI000B9B1EB0|nr:MFS transporter [Rhodococcus sp. 14-2483-1-2]OZF37354.1 hypothetical protein CH295_06735 [Rhodococcus sp. 14-2483-1-2]
MASRDSIALTVQATTAQAGWVGVRLMIGYRAIAEGADTRTLAVIAALFAAPAVLAALPIGRIADRFGGPVVIVSGIVLCSIATGVLVAFSAMWALLACTAAFGLGNLLIMIGQQAFVAHVHVDGKNESAFGALTAAASMGQLVGPLAVTAVASRFGGASVESPNTTAGILTAGAFTAVALPTALFLMLGRNHIRAQKPAEGEASGLKLLKLPGMWQSLTVSGAVLVTVDLLYAFVPAWAVERGVSVTTVGWLLALRAGVSVVSRVGLGRLDAKFGRTVLLNVSLAAGAIALAVLPFVQAVGAIGVMIALGIALGIPQPLTMSWVVSIVPKSTQGEALGLRMSANRSAQILIPLTVGAIAGPFGVTGILLGNALVLGGSIVAASHPRSRG